MITAGLNVLAAQKFTAELKLPATELAWRTLTANGNRFRADRNCSIVHATMVKRMHGNDALMAGETGM